MHSPSSLPGNSLPIRIQGPLATRLPPGMINAGRLAGLAGFCCPVYLSIAAWAECVAWNDLDSLQQIPQDTEGRLWDVLLAAAHGLRENIHGDAKFDFVVQRIPRDGWSTGRQQTVLRLQILPGPDGRTVMQVVLPYGEARGLRSC